MIALFLYLTHYRTHGSTTLKRSLDLAYALLTVIKAITLSYPALFLHTLCCKTQCLKALAINQLHILYQNGTLDNAPPFSPPLANTTMFTIIPLK